jgi:hypothetical protein
MANEEVSTCFLGVIAVVFFDIPENINWHIPLLGKNDTKTILNKFVCKGLNANFVKLWPVF